MRFRPAAARQTKPGQRHGGAHQFQETAPRPFVALELGRAARETRARASREIPAYRSARPGCANSASRFALPVDARRRVSSVAPLAVERRLDVPTLFQCSADLLLRQLFLLRPVIRLRLSAGHIWRRSPPAFPIPGFQSRFVDLRFRAQEIFGVPMALEAPRHAVGLGVLDDRHLVDLAVAARATDPAVHVRGVIVINVIRACDGAAPTRPVAPFSSSPAPARASGYPSAPACDRPCRFAYSADSSAPPHRRNCGNNGNPSRAGPRGYRAGTAPAGSGSYPTRVYFGVM